MEFGKKIDVLQAIDGVKAMEDVQTYLARLLRDPSLGEEGWNRQHEVLSIVLQEVLEQAIKLRDRLRAEHDARIAILNRQLETEAALNAAT
jgi:hypothetical protein